MVIELVTVNRAIIIANILSVVIVELDEGWLLGRILFC